jgi:probable F420-dependent oxidoreductase
MRFGLAIPNCCEGIIYPISFANYESMIVISEEAEGLGYDSVWANDHMSTLKYIKEYVSQPPRFFEPIVTLSFVAETTKRLKLGTSVIVLPLRDPVLLAKQVSTLHTLSDGRVILGLGIGAYREEFEAINPVLKTSRRDEIMDEKLQALKKLLEEDKASFDGKYVKFFEIEFYPKPAKPLPIWIGGNSLNVIKRVCKLCDGWLPAMLTPDEVRNGAEKICEYARKFGRDPSKIEIAPTYVVSLSSSYKKAIKNFRKTWAYKHLVSLKNSTLKGQSIKSYEERNLIGTPDEVIKKIDHLKEAGITYLSDLVFPAKDIQEFRKQITLFAREVIPSFQ